VDRPARISCRRASPTAATRIEQRPRGTYDTREYLADDGPESADAADASPIGAALNRRLFAHRGRPDVDERVVVLITDGGGSCTSVATPPRPAYTDNDWSERRVDVECEPRERSLRALA